MDPRYTNIPQDYPNVTNMNTYDNNNYNNTIQGQVMMKQMNPIYSIQPNQIPVSSAAYLPQKAASIYPIPQAVQVPQYMVPTPSTGYYTRYSTISPPTVPYNQMNPSYQLDQGNSTAVLVYKDNVPGRRGPVTMPTINYQGYMPMIPYPVSKSQSPINTSSNHTINIKKGGKVRCKCPYKDCPYKGTFMSKDYLRRHIREQHKHSRPHACYGINNKGVTWGCGKRFNRPYQLANHWKTKRSLERCHVPDMILKKYGIIRSTKSLSH